MNRINSKITQDSEVVDATILEDSLRELDSEDDEKGEIEGATFLLNLPVVLPPAPQAWLLLQEFLVDWNKAIPLFEPEGLVKLYTDVFSHGLRPDCLRLKAIYSSLAIAYRLRAMSPMASDTDDYNAKSFTEQTSAALPRILVADASLPSAQYLISMAVVMHGTHDPQGTRCLLAAALRMILDLSPKSIGYNAAQATRVFWIASCIETDVAFRRGQWSNGVIHPGPTFRTIIPSHDVGILPIGSRLFPVFEYRTQLARIQAQFLDCVRNRYDSLHVGIDNSQRYSENLQTILANLTAWREGDPVFRSATNSFRHQLHRSDLVHLLVLEATYFHTLLVVNGALQHVGPYGGSVMLHLHRYRSLEFQKYLHEARRLLKIFNLLTHGDVAVVWLTIEAVTLGVYVLSVSILTDVRVQAADALIEHLRTSSLFQKLMRELLQKRSQKRLRVALAELERLHQGIETASKADQAAGSQGL
jgi:hypothetical protein